MRHPDTSPDSNPVKPPEPMPIKAKRDLGVSQRLGTTPVQDSTRPKRCSPPQCRYDSQRYDTPAALRSALPPHCRTGPPPSGPTPYRCCSAPCHTTPAPFATWPKRRGAAPYLHSSVPRRRDSSLYLAAALRGTTDTRLFVTISLPGNTLPAQLATLPRPFADRQDPRRAAHNQTLPSPFVTGRNRAVASRRITATKRDHT